MISFPEGTSYPISLVAQDIVGNVINLDDAEDLVMKVYWRPREGSDAVLVKEDADIVVTDADAGAFTVTIDAGDLAEGEYSFDCYCTLDAVPVGLGRGEIDVTHFDSLEA